MRFLFGETNELVKKEFTEEYPLGSVSNLLDRFFDYRQKAAK